MNLAVQSVKNGEMGYTKALKFFSVPRTTLRWKLKETLKPVKRGMGRQTALPPQAEKELHDHILLMESRGFGFTRVDLKCVF